MNGKHSPGWVVCVVLAFTALAGAGQGLSVKVVDEEGRSTVIRQAQVRVYTNRGYSSGSTYLDFGGIYVTPDRLPPLGARLKPSRIPWKMLSVLVFEGTEERVTDGKLGLKDVFQRVAIKLRDGSERKAFIWTEGYYESWITAWPTSFRIAGQTEEEPPLEIEYVGKLKVLEFH